MRTIRLFRNPDCARCARIAATHRRFDWLRRFEDSTATPPGSAPLRIGEIAVQDLGTGRVLKGIECLRLLFRQIPAYWAALPFTYVGPVRRRLERDIRGCADDACETP